MSQTASPQIEISEDQPLINENTIIRWSRWQKTGFRLLFLFFGIYIMMGFNFPFRSYIMEPLFEVIDPGIVWIGKNILNISYEINTQSTGSSDTTYEYLYMLLLFSISLCGTVVWSALDRKRTNYETLYYWLLVMVRFYLAYILISYGMAKIFKSQFPSPSLYRLTQNYGDSSPMGLAWTFLGFSKAYNWFMGISELAVILLFFRRTALLGALITVATTANIVMVNFCFDVCVKLFSSTLFLMSVFLAAQEGRALFYFFIKNEFVKFRSLQVPVLNKRWMRVAKIGVKTFFIGYILYNELTEPRPYQQMFGDGAPKPPLYGMYKVTHFLQANDTIAPLTTSRMRWKTMFIEFPGYARVRHMSDSVTRVFTKVDTIQKHLEFSLMTDTTVKFHFRYEAPSGKQFVMRGRIKDDSVVVAFDRTINPEKEFLLTDRGFHWISEMPFNR
jgi:hypothetical protein